MASVIEKGSEYAAFLKTKQRRAKAIGIEPADLNPALFDFQRDIVRWSCRQGRAAIFADCGLGKTLMQLEWAHQIGERTLILAPLAVAKQTETEAQKFGIACRYLRADDGCSKIVVANYEMMQHFDPKDFGAVVLDESSILKNFAGHFRNALIEAFAQTPYRLACTATPAPNDYVELGNHSEFLGVMKRQEMLATFFVHEGQDTHGWRLKGHAQDDFWQWVASWAVVLRKPSDLGYQDDGFKLPKLNVVQHLVDGVALPGQLFPLAASGLRDRIKTRKATVQGRAKAAAVLAEASPISVVWCALNAEAETVADNVPGMVNLRGSDTSATKESALTSFALGGLDRLATKPSIAGFGMNLQRCSNVIFLGISDSWEQYYQAVRRCWRFGQTQPVNVHIVVSEGDRGVLANVMRKEEEASSMFDSIVEHTKANVRENLADNRPSKNGRQPMRYETGSGWEMIHGDCVEGLGRLKDESIDFSIFSPPFADLYTYTDDERDLGNSNNQAQFLEHFRYVAEHLQRLIAPGRLVSIHCMNLPKTITRDGTIGIKDFRGDVIRLFESVGFVYHSEVCIWKDPVTAMQRTKALGLLHKQIVKDSTLSRMGIPDYLCTFRKPGENASPVQGELTEFIGDPATFTPAGRFSIDVWQRYASPIWTDIRQSRTLQRDSQRDEKDEKHIAPLQLDVIERCLQLWTNPGDLVLSPFAGIGSEGYASLRMGRRFLGVELKESYFQQACKNLTAGAAERDQSKLFKDENVEVMK